MPLRDSIKAIVDAPVFAKIIMVLIILNAAILGLETYPAIMAQYGSMLKAADQLLLWIFVFELLLRFAGHGPRMFRDPWSTFDVIVVGIAFLPANGAFAVLRAARVLRVLRLISIFPRLKRVVEGLISAIPGIGSIAAILIIVFYVFAVMATKLYGAQYPLWFGTLHGSFFTLFQIMTLEGWADIVREIMTTHPAAWAFFVAYILAATFTVLNLFIAVIVDAMQQQHQAEELADNLAEADAIARIEKELARLHARFDSLKV